LSLSPSGSISGTPTSGGVYSFTVQATDSAQNTSTGMFTVTITSSPLAIATIAPLFSGVVGQPYAQTLSASGGKPPYAWSVSGTLPAGLSLNSSAGTIAGTPTAPGTSNFTLQVTDSASASAQQAFSITINAPTLTLSLLSPLPSAKVGVSYSQKLPVSASGGTAPYVWALKSGSVPGLSFDPVAVALTGTPSTAGTFNLTVQVSDATGLSATAALTLTVNAASLTITTAGSLPDGVLNAPYMQTLAASGGIPPYTWSATGLPAGLTLGASNAVLSGAPSAAGSFAIAITVQDSSLSSYSNRFTLNVDLPPAPGITLSGLPATAAPAQQYALTVTLAGAYAADITGQLLLTFSPDTGPADETIQFASGGATETFTIPAGSTTAMASAPLALQTGTVSGTLTVSLRLQAGGVDITPTPAPSVSAQIAAAAPVITNLQSSVSGNTLNIIVTGYATSRDMMQAIFAFSAAAGQSLQSTASSITIDVSSLFDQWFTGSSSAQFGTEFIFTQPFSIQGSAGSVMPVSVTLVNRIGQTTSNF
jgi:large repetitive protein